MDSCRRKTAVLGSGPSAIGSYTGGEPKAEVRNFSFYYGAKQALKNINMPIEDGAVTALIGPSGCGKSTLLRCLQPHARPHPGYPLRRRDHPAIRTT